MGQRGTAFAEIKALEPATREDIEQRLMQGTPAREVAEHCQQHGLWPEKKLDTVKKMLERYRSQELKKRVIANVEKVAAYTSAAALQKRLNAVDELESLAEKQRSRFEKALKKETSLPEGMLLKQVSEEARLLKDVLVELGRIQLETGILIRAPKKVTGVVRDDAGRIQEFSWTEEQEQLYRDLERYDVVDVTPQS